MLRWCVSKVEQYEDPLVGTAYRAKVAKYGVGTAVLIPTGPDGVPLFPWALVLINAEALTGIAADAEIDLLPDITLDAKLSTLTTQQRNALLTRLQNRGIDTSGLTLNSTFRELIRRVGRHLRADFDENSLGLR